MRFFDWVKDNWITVTATIITTVATGGTNLIAVGIAFGAGLLLDEDRKKREAENQQLALKGEVSKEIRQEINNLQDERTQKASQANTIDQQIAQKQSKLNDPNISETEKAQIRSEIAASMSSKGSLEKEIKGLDEKITTLLKNAQQTISGKGGLSNLEMDYQTKLIIAAVVFAIIYFMMIKDSDGR